MHRILTLIVLLAFVAAIAGCASKSAKEEETAAAPAEQQAADADQTYGAELGGAFAGSPIDDPASPLSKRVFYFEFDSNELSSEDREIIKAHAQYLAQNPGTSIVLEGHADERGTREYNMALGERRAKSVLQLLVLQGASNDQVQTISFGEERPVALGHDESAWRLNRRAELLYSGSQ
ncbi:MAG: peptidoglycan-associated lipoprotein Pal [Pseudomonadota bacterium]|nr:MAG: peptidoglycan-associated lipoprotein Pal [Pseudomonadota bacterium]